jgi:hypothetical protein
MPRRIHVITRGREMTFSRSIAASDSVNGEDDEGEEHEHRAEEKHPRHLVRLSRADELGQERTSSVKLYSWCGFW